MTICGADSPLRADGIGSRVIGWGIDRVTPPRTTRGAIDGPLAAGIRGGERQVLDRLSLMLLKPQRDNVVHRPWGGSALADYKRLDGDAATEPKPWGEAFELSADDDDTEARLHPSWVDLPDGSRMTLAEILRHAGETLLGRSLVERFGHKLPILPKTLDVAELLSVQAHPDGYTEAYVIIDAQPGATLSLGFRDDVDARWIRQRLQSGRELQQQLLEALDPTIDQSMLQSTLGAAFGARAGASDSLAVELAPRWTGRQGDGALAALLEQLEQRFWEVLGLLNTLPVSRGAVIHNANPPGLAERTGRRRSAEVHALGNPQRRAVLALEVRRPCPTFRAWDHVRFPLRDIDIDRTVEALNLNATDPDAFMVAKRPAIDRPAVFHSVDDESFTIDHLCPTPAQTLVQPATERAHTLHTIEGSVVIERPGGEPLAELNRGESALVPAPLGEYRLTARQSPAEVVQVWPRAGQPTP